MENSIVKNYEGYNIAFQKDKNVMVNATEMAKPFGKTTKDWIRTNSAQEFIASLSAVRQILPTELVVVRQGGDPQMQGTWMHEDVALEFARWLSPKFAIWCNDQIKELLTTGSVSLNVPKTAKTRSFKYLLWHMQSTFSNYHPIIRCEKLDYSHNLIIQSYGK